MLTQRINSATHTLVVVGAYANSYHPDRAEIGERNWQWWEIRQSVAAANKMLAVKIDRRYQSPTPLLDVKASWAHAFKVEAIIRAIDAA